MSGDVQPRKRKDKKKKRDSLDSRKSEGDIFARKFSLKEDDDIRESHHGVHAAKLGTDDVLLHVQGEHTTGGHWCAKILFFSLLAILVGLIGLIIMENRGLSDMDTPLSESRYSEYFEGWVDEHRQSHDEHDKVAAELHDHDEPFEEEEDHSEQDDDNGHDDEHDEDEDHHEDDNENEEPTESDNKDDADDDDEEQNEQQDNEEEEEDRLEKEIEEKLYSRFQRNENDDDNDKDDKNDDDNDNESADEGIGDEIDDTNDDNNDPPSEADKEDEQESELNKYDFQNENDPFDETQNNTKKEFQKNIELTPKLLEKQVDLLYKNIEILEQTFKEIENLKSVNKVEDDANDDSLEEVIENDAEELAHLERKAKEQEENDDDKQNDEEEESSSIAVKIIVGLALVFVARLVFLKKTDKNDEEEPVDEVVSMKRRLTMITAEEPIPWDGDEKADDLENDEIEEIEEIRNSEEKEEQHQQQKEEEKEEKNKIDSEDVKPKTFEMLSSMYRPQKIENLMNLQQDNNENLSQKSQQKIKIQEEIEKPKINEEIKRRVQEEISKKIMPELGEFSKNEQIEKKEETKIPSSQTQEIIPKSIMKKNDEKYEISKDNQKLLDESVVEEEEAIEEEEIEDDEELGDEEEEEEYDDEDVEEVSDVDDEELMKRLEEKYGKLPESHNYDSEEEYDEEDIDDTSWTKIKSRTGPQSVFTGNREIDNQLSEAEDMLLQNNLKSSLKIYESILLDYPNNPGALYGKAKVLDRLSDKYQSNHMLTEAVDAYKRFLTTINNDKIKIDNQTFIEAAERCIDRMRFRGLHLQAVPIHEMLIKRFDDTPKYRNQLAVTYLLINRLSDAKHVLHETLLRWRNDGFAQVHYGFILKNLDKDLIRAVKFLQDGIETNDNGTQDGRFYFHLGDALQRLGRINEAKLIYRKGAKLKLFLSEYQRSLYNINGLKAKPYWTEIETTYDQFFKLLKNNWKLIRDEGLNILNSKGLFMDEVENLKDIGDWKQYELFIRGYKNMKNCEKAPITCKLIETFPAARYCKRGQTKFSVMHPNTHVWPHCGPTNCRLRAHLGLKVPSGTKIRVANEERTWQEGEFLIFDDSFEHEVWHNGTELRLVLIVDVWHPELTDEQQKTLTPI